MLQHLGSSDWGHRDFDYANVPLAWAHEVLMTLLDDGHHSLAEDLAVAFFEVEPPWNRFKQKAATMRWLRSLAEPEGAVVARAIRRAGTHVYYSGLAGTRLPSRSLAAEFVDSDCRSQLSRLPRVRWVDFLQVSGSDGPGDVLPSREVRDYPSGSDQSISGRPSASRASLADRKGDVRLKLRYADRPEGCDRT